MPRKGPIPKREVLPDPLYSSRLVTKFVNRLMFDGKKGAAEKIFYSSLETLAEKTGEEPMRAFEKALDNPSVIHPESDYHTNFDIGGDPSRNLVSSGCDADGDVEAAQRLILSHLRLVISIARGFLGYGLPYADLIQEGNIGLMKAIRHYDPDRGARLMSFAVHWIRSEIQEYIIRNWRIVKLATTKNQRKLFFNLRQMKEDPQTALTNSQAEHIALALDVKPKEVLEMEELEGMEPEK